MRARFFVLGGGVTLVAAAFVIQACGSTESTATATDAGTDVVVDSAPQDTGPPKEQDSATCDLSADFTDEIPDAAIADGASTSGLCVQCANTKCEQQVAACNQDCDCQQIAGQALDCFVKHPTNPQLCAAPFLGVNQKTQTIGIDLLTCIQGSCKKPCATDSFNNDGGNKDGGDGGDGG